MNLGDSGQIVRELKRQSINSIPCPPCFRQMGYRGNQGIELMAFYYPASHGSENVPQTRPSESF